MIHHGPHKCGSCGAPILWAQVLNPDGTIKRKPDGKIQAMPVNFEPDPKGNVLLADRGGSIVARVLHRGEAPPAGAILRTAHSQTCIHREDWHAVSRAKKLVDSAERKQREEKR